MIGDLRALGVRRFIGEIVLMPSGIWIWMLWYLDLEGEIFGLEFLEF